jgi:RNA polymerase sigma factor (TIGR02999 family)
MVYLCFFPVIEGGRAMIPSTPQEVTQLLQAWTQGEESALQKLIPLVYQELHRVAHRYMGREQPGHVLQTTALVNEAYLRLVDSSQQHWQNRAHFFAISAKLMRQILVDYARSHLSQKRGGDVVQISLEDAPELSDEKDVDLIRLDEALKGLAALDERKGRMVELRFFGGLNVEETAEVLKVSANTVLNDWSLAKAWLYREMKK